MRRSAWLKPGGKLVVAAAVVAGLGWLGARTAASSPQPPELEVVPAMVSEQRALLEPKGEAIDAGAAAASDGGKVRAGVTADGRVVLNAADEQELCRLPGVGPSRAKRILALRDKLVRFESFRQLLRVKGIGPRTLRRLEPMLVLDAPEQDAGS